MRRVAIAIDRMDWHAGQLREAFRAHAIEPVFFPLRAAAFTPHGLAIPGFDGLPDAVFARAIAVGGFEEITRRLGLLHGLRELGVTVWNDARAIERCVDKSATAFFLAQAGLPTPETWTVEGAAAARDVVAEAGGELVLKPLFGAQGRGLMRLRAPADLPPPEAVNGVYHLQRYIPPGAAGFCDYRLLVCRGAVIAAMARRGADWITNIHRGGRAAPLDPPADLVALAIAAAAAVGADYAGVDLIRDASGDALVLEVNSMPGWRGLQSVSSVPIAARLAAALAAALESDGR